MLQDNKYIKLVKNIGIIFFGRAGSKLLIYFLIPFYTKYLSPAEFGLSDLIVTYATMLLNLVTCQIQEAIFVFPKGESKERQSAFFSSGLSLIFMSFGTYAVLFAVLQHFMPSGWFFSRYLWIITGYLFLDGLQMYFQQFCRSIDKMVIYSVSGIACSFGTLISSLILIPYFRNGASVVYANYFGLLCGSVTSFTGAKMYRYFVWKWNFQDHFKPMLFFALPMIPSAVMWWMVSNLNKIFISDFLGMDALGIFSVAFRITNILFYLWNVLGNAWQISVLEEFKNADFHIYFSRMLDRFLLLHFIIFAGMSAGAPFYMKFFVAPDFYSAYLYIPILAFSAIFSNAAGFLGTLFSANKKTRYFLYSSLVSIILIFPVNYYCIKLWALNGAAISVAVIILVQFFVRYFFAGKFIKIVELNVKFMLTLSGVFILCGFYCATVKSLQILFYLCSAAIMLYFSRKELQLLKDVYEKIIRKKMR